MPNARLKSETDKMVCRLSQLVGSVHILGRRRSFRRPRRAEWEDPPVYRSGRPGTPGPLYYLVPDPADPRRGFRIYFEEVTDDD